MNRNISKPLRKAYIEALAGKVLIDGVVIKGYDNWNIGGESNHHYIIGEIADNNQSTLDTHISETFVTLHAFSKQSNAYSSEEVEDMEDQILQILIPYIGQTPLVMDEFHIANVRKTFSNASPEANENGYLAHRIITIGQLITVKNQ